MPDIFKHTPGEPCCGCACFPLASVPKLKIPGFEAAGEWVPREETQCCWTKAFTSIEPNDFVDNGDQLVEHVANEGHITWEAVGLTQSPPFLPGIGCSYTGYGVIGTFHKELRNEWKRRWKYRVKYSDTIQATWSKVCDADCGSTPGDRWILQLSFNAEYLGLEQTQYWQADRYTNSIPGRPPCYPMYWPPFTVNRWDDAAASGWWGGTNLLVGGGAYQQGGSGLPPKEDIWLGSSNGIAGEASIVRYKVFTEIPETETVVEIHESDLLQECEINTCIVDDPIDGDELLDEQEAFLCDLTFEISTGPTKSCQLFTGGPVYSMTQDYVEVFHQGISQGPLDTAMLLVGQHVNQSVPFGFNFTGSPSLCLGFRVSDFETTVDCVLSGDATYVIAPSMEVTIEQA